MATYWLLQSCWQKLCGWRKKVFFFLHTGSLCHPTSSVRALNRTESSNQRKSTTVPHSFWATRILLRVGMLQSLNQASDARTSWHTAKLFLSWLSSYLVILTQVYCLVSGSYLPTWGPCWCPLTVKYFTASSLKYIWNCRQSFMLLLILSNKFHFYLVACHSSMSVCHMLVFYWNG